MFSPTCLKLALRLRELFCSALFAFCLLTVETASAQISRSALKDTIETDPTEDVVVKPAATKKDWYEKISLRGYLQVRYNRLLETNPEVETEHDKSIGDKGGFMIRRARLVFSGQVHEHVFMYIQPDLAVTPPGSSSIHFAQLRDAYFDLSLDSARAYRFRIGQSKVPFGFENMQSSSNRPTLDRNDALNSGVPNERELGVMFYWAPAHIRERFSKVGNSRLKGSGDYGVFGLGIYNGQSTNKNEENNNLHAVARLSYPIKFKNGQIIEPGIQGYTGLYTITSSQLSNGTVKGGSFEDRRVAASFMMYPQPFGFLAEYNVGKSPEFDPETRTIKEASLHGGYALAMYSLKIKNHRFMPFAKAQFYEGGKKAELDARFTKMHEFEFGIEWQPISAFELTTQYTITDRLNKDGRNLNNRMQGNFLRIQAQFNY